MTALPLQASVGDLALTLSAAFTPELLLGISLFSSGAGSAGVGVQLNLPKLDVEIKPVKNADHKCNPLKKTSDANTLRGDNFTSLINVIPKVELDLELVAQAEIKAGAFSVNDDKAVTVLRKEFALPTTCLSFDAGRKSLETARVGLGVGGGGGNDGTKTTVATMMTSTSSSSFRAGATDRGSPRHDQSPPATTTQQSAIAPSTSLSSSSSSSSPPAAGNKAPECAALLKNQVDGKGKDDDSPTFALGSYILCFLGQIGGSAGVSP